MKKLLLLCAAAVLTLQLSAFTAFDQDKWSADIVIPDDPDQAETFAANELQYHFGKIYGVKPAIIKESQSGSQPYHFYIGNTSAARSAGLDKSKFAMDAHQIKNVKNGLIFIGGDRNGKSVGHAWSAACQGTLYAVYDYLENDFGVKWLFPGEFGELIPQRKQLVVGTCDRSGKEPLVGRRLRVSGNSTSPKMIGWRKQSSRAKFFAEQELFLIRHRMGATENLFHGHNFDDYWRTYGKDHPEYFSLLPNGKREPLKGDPTGQYITMCVSNPDLHRLIVSKWKKSITRANKNNPPLINLCENDTPGMCICDNCRAWDADDPRFATSEYWGKKQDPLTRRGRFIRLARVKWGEDGDQKDLRKVEPPSLSDRYSKFYMAVLKEAKKVNPNARAIVYAYANYADAPKETRLDKDIILNFVPGTGFPYSEEDSTFIRQNIVNWRKAGIRDFILRPNYMLMGANMPLNLGRRITRDFTFAYRNGMIATNFDSLTGAWANQGMMLYSLIRLHRQPELTYEESFKEYCSIFAPADQEIAAYLNFWENFSTSITDAEFRKICADNPDRFGNFGGGNANFFTVSAALYPPEIFVKANKLLDAAAKRAAGNEVVLKRIDYLRKGLRDAELSRNCREAQKAWQSSKGDKAERTRLRNQFHQAFRIMNDYRASIENESICNFSHFALREQYNAGWPHKTVNLKRKKK